MWNIESAKNAFTTLQNALQITRNIYFGVKKVLKIFNWCDFSKNSVNSSCTVSHSVNIFVFHQSVTVWNPTISSKFTNRMQQRGPFWDQSAAWYQSLSGNYFEHIFSTYCKIISQGHLTDQSHELWGGD